MIEKIFVIYKNAALIKSTKTSYLSSLGNKLNDPNIGPKKYWSILNKFMNKRKAPIIPPIRQGTFVTTVAEKVSLFNNLFANQCTLINTSSSLPNFEFITNSYLDTVDFSYEDILLFIRNLNPNKVHGWDEIFARMLKICDENVVPPLLIIFKTALASGTFPISWKKENIVPILKKQEKALVKNYRPISLLSILGKFLEKYIYNCIYSYFETNALFSPCQSGFRKNDSCTSQLLVITHEIF